MSCGRPDPQEVCPGAERETSAAGGGVVTWPFWQSVRLTWAHSRLGVHRTGCFFLHFHSKDEIVRR